LLEILYPQKENWTDNFSAGSADKMDKGSGVWGLIMFFAGLGAQLSGYVNIYAASLCWAFGLILFLYAVRNRLVFWWPGGMMLLKEASNRLHEELYRIGFNEKTSGPTINDINVLAFHISQVVDIYGKCPPFETFKKISDEELKMGNINRDGTIFYYYENGKEKPKYIELSIKKSDCKKAIRRITPYWS
jgi:hypothetical protein